MFQEEQIYYHLKNNIWNLELDNAEIIFNNIKFVAVEDLRKTEEGSQIYRIYGDIPTDIGYEFSIWDEPTLFPKIGHLISLDQRYLLRCAFLYIDISEKSCICNLNLIKGVEYEIDDKIEKDKEIITFLDLLDID